MAALQPSNYDMTRFASGKLPTATDGFWPTLNRTNDELPVVNGHTPELLTANWNPWFRTVNGCGRSVIGADSAGN